MTLPSLAELRKIAEAVLSATKSYLDYHGPDMDEESRRGETVDRAQAAFVNAVDVPTVLALLDRLEAAESEVKAWRERTGNAFDALAREGEK